MFISDFSCISHQKTYQTDFFSNLPCYQAVVKYYASEPDYADIIPASALRRMGKIIRMGVATGLPLLHKHADCDGIIIGTANGGVDDSMKFLSQIEKYNEGTLTPTHFIQSTPNSLAGLLSMMSGNKGYNNTHVHEGLAFENALIDAQMILKSKNKILAGAAEEISDWNFNINKLLGRYKTANNKPEALLKSGTPGSVCGEGAFMFVLQNHSENAVSEIVDVSHIVTNDFNEVKILLKTLLLKNNLSHEDIDGLILGYNGDVTNDKLYDSIYNDYFASKAVFSFKNLSGEFPTASAFALWLGINIFTHENIHKDFVLVKSENDMKYMLIYNHYFGLQHGFILIKRPSDGKM